MSFPPGLPVGLGSGVPRIDPEDILCHPLRKGTLLHALIAPSFVIIVDDNPEATDPTNGPYLKRGKLLLAEHTNEYQSFLGSHNLSTCGVSITGEFTAGMLLRTGIADNED